LVKGGFRGISRGYIKSPLPPFSKRKYILDKIYSCDYTVFIRSSEP